MDPEKQNLEQKLTKLASHLDQKMKDYDKFQQVVDERNGLKIQNDHLAEQMRKQQLENHNLLELLPADIREKYIVLDKSPDSQKYLKNLAIKNEEQGKCQNLR